MLRLIKEEEPPRPSARLSGSETLPALAAQRHVEPLKLTKLVRGELDWIVMKCLEKDRSRRYETANGLARDVERYLADEVVEARPPSASYRLKKLARRYRAVLATAAGFAGLLVLAALVFAWQAVRASRAEVRAAAERDASQKARQQADRNFQTAMDAVERYLSNVTENPNLKQADFYQLRKELLETALPFFEKLAQEESFDPKLQCARGQAYERLARLRFEMGDRVSALANFARALKILESLAVEYPALPLFRQRLASTQSFYAGAMNPIEQRVDAEGLLHRAIALQEQLVADFPSEVEYRNDLGTSYSRLGIVLAAGASDGSLIAGRGKPDEAATEWRKALAVKEKLAVEFPTEAQHHREMAGILNNLANLPLVLGDSSDAQALFEKAISHQEKALALEPHNPTSRAFLSYHHDNLATVLDEKGRWTEALEHSRTAALGLERLVDDFPTVLQYRRRLGFMLMDLGNRFDYLGRLDDAIATHEKALRVQEKLAADFPDQPEYVCQVGGSLDNLATAVWRTGQRTEAIRYFKEAIQRGKKVLERDPQNEMARRFQAEHHAKLGILLTEIGRRTEAETHQNEALALRIKLLADFAADPEYPLILALSHSTRGLWLADLGQWDEAELEHRKALNRRLNGVKLAPMRSDRQIELAVSNVSLGNLTRDRGEPQQSLDWYSKAITAMGAMHARESRYVPVRDLLRDAHSGQARAFDRLGRYAEAVQDWDQAVKLDDGIHRAVLKLGRAISEAHAKDNHRKAISEAQHWRRTLTGRHSAV
jgi:tetratricopeptide (TPR) repeat protein